MQKHPFFHLGNLVIPFFLLISFFFLNPTNNRYCVYLCTVMYTNIIVYLSLSFIPQGLTEGYKKTELFTFFTVALHSCSVIMLYAFPI